MNARVSGHGPAHELVFPARLALDVKNAAAAARNVDHAAARVVARHLLVGRRLQRKTQIADTRVPGAEVDPFALNRLVRPQRDLFRGEHGRAVLDRDTGGPLAAPVMADGQLGADSGVRQRLRRHDDIGKLDVVGNFLAADADRMHRNFAPAYLRHQLAVESAGVVRAVADDQYRPQRHGRGLAQDIRQRFADPAARSRRRQMLVRERFEAVCVTGKSIEPDAEFFLQFVENRPLQGGNGLLQPRPAARAQRHAARSVEQDRNYVLPVLERLHGETRLPQHQQRQRNRSPLERPNRRRTAALQAARGTPRVPPQAGAGRGDQHQQQPKRPAAGKHEPALAEGRQRILEKKLEHRRCSNGSSHR